jgi:regulator of cell morphogenesis and NO signaling
MRASENRLETGVDWASEPLDRLIGHIVEKHHEYLRTELPRLAQLTASAIAECGGHSEQLQRLQRLFLELKEELESHLWKEERVLFPLAGDLDEASRAGGPAPISHCGSVANPIHVMELEHGSAKGALAEMRRLTTNYELPEGAPKASKVLFAGLTELEANLHQHIHLEDDILFPRVTRLEASLA